MSAPRTICFDLRALQVGHENRGIGMYVRSVLEHLVDDGNRYIFYCFDRDNPIEKYDIVTRVDYRIVQTPTIVPTASVRGVVQAFELYRHDFAALRELRPDVFVQFEFTLGLPKWPGVRTVVLGYDLIPLIRRNEYLPSPRYAWSHSPHRFRGAVRAAYHRLRYRLYYDVYRRADLVLCISADAAASFHLLLGVPTPRLREIPLAPVVGAAGPDYSVAERVGRPYVFYIGGSDRRKRVEDIVRAFNIARGRGADLALVLAGHEFGSPSEVPDPIAKRAIMDSPYRGDIEMVGFVSDGEKLGLYRRAHAFLFTSSHEGFGLPVVEAMAAGCPVIAYDNSSIPQAAGDAGLLVETGDYVAVARGILQLFDAAERADQIDRGRANAATFDWDAYAQAFQAML